MTDVVPPREDGYDRIPLQCRHLVDAVLITTVEDWTLVRIPTEKWTLPTRLRRVFMCHLAMLGSTLRPVTTQRLFVNFQDSDLPPPTRAPVSLEDHPNISDFQVIQRWQALRLHPAWMASDEVELYLDALRIQCPHTLFCPPVRWNIRIEIFEFDNARAPDVRFHMHVVWLAVIETTWIQVELVNDGASGHFQDIASYIASILGREASQIQQVFIPRVSPPNMCGWVLLQGILINHVLHASRHHELLDEIFSAATHLWTNSQANEASIDLAFDTRSFLLFKILEGRISTRYFAAGGPDDRTSKTPSAPSAPATAAPTKSPIRDPWLDNDPWAKKPKKLFSTR